MPSESIDVGIDLGEVLLDSFLEEGLARELPILGSLVKAAKACGGASDALLLAKVRLFLWSVDDVSDAERAQFAYEMKRDPEVRDRVAESVTFALQHADEFDKARITATVFRALVRRWIDPMTFRRLMRAVGQVFAPDLRAAVDAQNRGSVIPDELLRRLLPSGLAELPPAASSPNVPGSIRFALTPTLSSLGALLLDLLSDRRPGSAAAERGVAADMAAQAPV